MVGESKPLALGENVPVFTVSELSLSIRRTLEGAFERVRVRGEVSRPNYHGSGHLYFAFKDADACIDAVVWRATVARLGLRVEDGMEVICTGRVSSYPKSSKYQIVVDSIELAGEGALLKLLEDRKKKLAAEGLFDGARKRPIPFLPEVIGVITSPTGAVIRDILHRLSDRFPRRVIIWPVPVQGEGAAARIAAAIAGFNALAPGGAVPRPDVLIVARGGGSLEDLWAFNEEIVVRAAAASTIPLISAVGHETDTTLIDFASDRRAPTPTAAAEFAVPVRAELIAEVLDLAKRVVRCMARTMDDRRLRLAHASRGLPEPRRLIEIATQNLDAETDNLAKAMRNLMATRAAQVAEASAKIPHPRVVLKNSEQQYTACIERLPRLVARWFDDARRHLTQTTRLLDTLSYKETLKRGFSVVYDGGGRHVARAATAGPGVDLTVEFHDGKVAVRTEGGEARHAPAPARPRAPSRRAPPNGKQGSLL
jgi:exodeoxyribonuclease VII large subunit